MGITHANRLESDEKGTSGDFESLQASVTPDRGHQQGCSGDREPSAGGSEAQERRCGQQEAD